MLKTTVLHGAMDAESGREVRRSRVELVYEKIKGLIEELCHKEQSRDYVMGVSIKKHTPDVMDLSNVSQTKTEDDQQGDEEHQLEDQEKHLDAVGKGGNGKGGWMIYYRCGRGSRVCGEGVSRRPTNVLSAGERDILAGTTKGKATGAQGRAGERREEARRREDFPMEVLPRRGRCLAGKASGEVEGDRVDGAMMAAVARDGVTATGEEEKDGRWVRGQ